MKKRTLWITFLLLFLFSFSASAQQSIGIKINGVEKAFHPSALLVGNQTYLPLRSLFESFNMKVEWDAKTQTATATKQGLTVQVQINSPTMKVNGKTVALSAPVRLIQQSTYVPVRAISESLGYKVSWDAWGNAAWIHTDGSISLQEAEHLVRKQENVPSKTFVEYDHSEDGRYVIHVYDVVENLGDVGHTATWGWYYVHPKTGKIESMF